MPINMLPWARGIQKSRIIRACYRKVHTRYIATLVLFSPKLYINLRFKKIKGKWPDNKNPRTFDEKLLWLMLNWRHPLKTECGDKYTVRFYVKEHGLEHILPRLLGVYEDSSDIDFTVLPQRFVLKCTHGCGFNIICKNKNDLDLKQTRRTLDAWMKIDFSKVYGELHYALMKPRIICEVFLDDLSSDLPIDYKIFCFNGKAHCTMVCTEREINGPARYDFYDIEWKGTLPYNKPENRGSRDVPKPEAYGEMIAAAEVLSKPFPFVRVDFYSINGKAILGEMTFTPAGCIDNDLTDSAQSILGSMIRLPNKLPG